MLSLSIDLDYLLSWLGWLRLSYLLHDSTLNDLTLSIHKLSLSIHMYKLLLAWLLGHHLLLHHLPSPTLHYLSLTVHLNYLTLMDNLLLWRNTILKGLLLLWLCLCLALLSACLLSSSSLCWGQLER